MAQLRYQLNTVGITFTVAANHLNLEISQTPDYQLTRKISAVGSPHPGRGEGRGGSHGNGRGGGGRGRCRGGRGEKSGTTTGYFTPAEWNKLSFEERDKIRKERDKKGEQGGSKRAISELTTKQLTTTIISSSSIQKANSDETEETSKTSNSAGNSFGGRENAKRNKTD